MSTANGPVLETAIKALAQSTSYVYNARTGRYHEAGTNKMVSFEKAMSVFDSKERVDAGKLYNLASLYKEGKIPSGVWYQGTFDMLRKWHIQQAAHGAGGFNRLTPQDFKRISDILEEDRTRLIKFGEQLPTMGDGQIQYRLNLYLGNGRREYWRARRLPGQAKRPGYSTIERRLLLPGDNCEWCLKLADYGWQPYGVLPYPGEIDQSWYGHACLTNCRCKMERRYVKTENLGRYVKVPYLLSAPPEKAVEWVEAEHPRDEQGRFTDGLDTGTLSGKKLSWAERTDLNTNSDHKAPAPWSKESDDLSWDLENNMQFLDIDDPETGTKYSRWFRQTMAAQPPSVLQLLKEENVVFEFAASDETFQSRYRELAPEFMQTKEPRLAAKAVVLRNDERNPVILFRLSPDDPDATMVMHHELGHVLYPQRLSNKNMRAKMAWEKFYKSGGGRITEYSDANEWEGFSDAYMSYVAARGQASPKNKLFSETFDEMGKFLKETAKATNG